MIYLCATPIGNLEDITLRVLRVLKEVDYVAAEDSRQALKLLNHFCIAKPIISYHHHNMLRSGDRIISLAVDGKNIAVISDAGMPGISDPGAELVKLARENDIPITVLPGPSAALSGLVLSGMDAGRFVFEGFMPRDNKNRMSRMQALKSEERTIILYEAPHRLISTLEDLLTEVGNRNIAIARELTKIYEEVLMYDIEQALMHFREHAPRGEFVLILEGAKKQIGHDDFEGITIKRHIESYIEAGLEKKEAIKQVAVDRDIPKNQVYKHAIDL